ncbi:hypothetical protein EU538_07220 [Candidatus Thorarchaeota archaeon]|nr:MAG: hypothetical protein EU538_07220 [Candidatus Thorarchaeota archaeon]
MPRPGFLTKGRANRKITTPGGGTVVHRRNFYRASGTCALSGAMMQLPKNAKNNLSYKSSKSSKRPNRPYGGYAASHAVRRGIIRAARDL